MNQRRVVGWAVLTVMLLSFVVALPARAAMAAAPTGFLRVGHFVPDVGAVAVSVDGHLLAGALTFQQVTSYEALPAGEHTVEVSVAAAKGKGVSEHSAKETVVAGQSLTVLIVSNASDAMTVTSFTDNLSEPPAGDAKVRYIDTLSSVPSLSGSLTPVPDPPAPTAVAVPATPEGQASPYVDVHAGAYNVAFTNARTGAIVLTGKDWPVTAGTVASLIVLQGTDAPTLEVIKDAVGAATTPVGGMQTGAGGMALRASGRGFGGLGLEIGLVFALVGVVATGLLTRRHRGHAGLVAMACATGLVATSCGGESSVGATPPPTTTAGRNGWSPPASVATGQASNSAPSINLIAAGTAEPSNQPERLAVPAVGIDAPIVNLGRLPDGTMQVPASFTVAGWYDEGPPPGEPGPAVILGHVDSTTGPAVFWRLRDLRPGDQVMVTSAHGRETFEVTSIESAPKDAFPTAKVFGPVGDPELRLITCSGAFDRSTGHYVDNTIVFASLISG